MFDEKLEENLKELSKEQDALKSSIALNKILHGLLIQNKKEKLALWLTIILLIVLMALEGVAMFLYEQQFERVTEETETTWSYAEASGENSAINNVQGDQYNDHATKNKYQEQEDES